MHVCMYIDRIYIDRMGIKASRSRALLNLFEISTRKCIVFLSTREIGCWTKRIKVVTLCNYPSCIPVQTLHVGGFPSDHFIGSKHAASLLKGCVCTC